MSKLTTDTARSRARSEKRKAQAEEAPATEDVRITHGEVTSIATGNVPDDVVLKHGRKIKAAWDYLREAKEAQQAANGVYRAMLKDAKAVGINEKSMRRVIAALQLEVTEVDREERDFLRYARLMGLPVGTQMDLFEDAKTPATHIDETALGTHDSHDYYAEGYSRGESGKPSDNPYPANSKGAIAYLRGWDAAQFDARERILPMEEPA